MIPVIRISRASVAMRDSVIAGRNALTKDIERVRGIVFLSLSLHLRLPTLASLKGSLAIDTVDWPILIPEMEFHGMLERYFAAKCLGDDTRTPANTAPTSNGENANDDVFMGDICDNCQKCQLYFRISDVFHQFIGVLLMSQYSIFDLLECWEAVTVRRRTGNKQDGVGQSTSAANVDEDWVSIYVRQHHQQRVREIAEIIVESIETFAPFYDPRCVRLSQLSRFSQYSRFGTQAHGQAQAEALLRA